MIVVIGRLRTDADKRAELVKAMPATLIAPPDVKLHTIAGSLDLQDLAR